MTTILINNKFVSPKNAKISILSDSFARGYGIFETLRTYKDKKIFKAENHIKRLFQSAKKIDLKISYSENQIFQMLKKVIKKSLHKIQRLKIIAIGEGIIIISIPFKDDKNLYKFGVSCKTVICNRAIPEVKSISYLPSFLSHQQAEKYGYYEAILIDKTGEVFEGAYSNIFWFEKNNLCTRKTEILKGITRDTVLKISPFPIKFETINLQNLLKQKEIFLTQSTRGIVPIVKIDNKKIGNGQPGEKTELLIKLFTQEVSSSHTAP